jgi:hypothetical protein
VTPANNAADAPRVRFTGQAARAIQQGKPLHHQQPGEDSHPVVWDMTAIADAWAEHEGILLTEPPTVIAPGVQPADPFTDVVRVRVVMAGIRLRHRRP